MVPTNKTKSKTKSEMQAGQTRHNPMSLPVRDGIPRVVAWHPIHDVSPTARHPRNPSLLRRGIPYDKLSHGSHMATYPARHDDPRTRYPTRLGTHTGWYPTRHGMPHGPVCQTAWHRAGTLAGILRFRLRIELGRRVLLCQAWLQSLNRAQCDLSKPRM